LPEIALQESRPKHGILPHCWKTFQKLALNESISIQCPQCGESFEIALDISEGSAEFIVDCEVCCRPMTVVVRLRDGEIEGFDVTAA